MANAEMSAVDVATVGVYTPTQACRVLGNCSYASLNRLVAKGVVRRVQRAGQPGYVRADVEWAMKQRQVPEGYYSTSQAQALLGVSKRRFQELVQQYQVPWVKSSLRHGWSYSQEAIDALVQQRQAKPAICVSEWWPNNRQRFVRHYAVYFPRLVRWVTGRLRVARCSQDAVQTAEDLVQQTFMDLWERGAHYFTPEMDDEEVQRIIFRSVSNSVAGYWQVRHLQKHDSGRLEDVDEVGDWVEASQPSVEHQVLMREQLGEVWRHIQSYPPRVQQVMRWVAEGYEAGEIVELLEQEGIVRSQRMVERWREHIRKELMTPADEHTQQGEEGAVGLGGAAGPPRPVLGAPDDREPS